MNCSSNSQYILLPDRTRSAPHTKYGSRPVSPRLPGSQHTPGTGVLHRVRAWKPLGGAGTSSAATRRCRLLIANRSPSPSCSKLGCTEGRSAERWVDFNFFGHQVVAHLVDGYQAAASHNQGACGVALAPSRVSPRQRWAGLPLV